MIISLFYLFSEIDHWNRYVLDDFLDFFHILNYFNMLFYHTKTTNYKIPSEAWIFASNYHQSREDGGHGL